MINIFWPIKRLSLGLTPILIILFCSCTSTQQTTTPPLSEADTLRGVFYNVENLFDTENEPGKNDQDFLPSSEKEWRKGRYQRKVKDVASVLAAIVQEREFAFAGLAEVENEKVLRDLIDEPALDEYPLSIIHHNSPDERGIDVAFLYNDDYLTPIDHRAIPVTFPFDTADKTRDILYIEAAIANTDTMHFFVNHWPSRNCGVEASAPYRVQAAKTLKKQVQALKNENREADILIMGDFNDEPTNKSIQEVLGAQTYRSRDQAFYLYNLMSQFIERTSMGTYNYRGEWNLLDQIITSSPAFTETDGVYVAPQSAGIYKAPWLLYEKESGTKVPNRTYGGPTYYGGYSDHLPVFVDLMIHRSEN